jgi:predicted Rossmann-fold nucleotide-binding protein
VRVAIVGSRRRSDRNTYEQVFDVVRQLAREGNTIVSGGAVGPDSFAAEAAEMYSVECVVHKPDYTDVKSRWDAMERPLQRNQTIVGEPHRRAEEGDQVTRGRHRTLG